jgi:hypothetical protein
MEYPFLSLYFVGCTASSYIKAVDREGNIALPAASST